MYTPPFNVVDDQAELRAMVAAARTGWLVTVEDGAPVATLLPLMWTGDTLIAHLARANPQWRSMADGDPVLVICTGPDAYVSPTWYPAKEGHGRVVPTWNYTAVHLSGTVRVHHDPEWLLDAVTALTRLHESGRADPWQVADAPEPYVAGQLRGIVGIEVSVTRVEGKAKLSQNRSTADQLGVIEGLRAEGPQGAAGTDVADAMAARLAGSEVPARTPASPGSPGPDRG
jgi:transcriptional regulator